MLFLNGIVQWGAEFDHDPIAQKFVQRSLILKDFIEHHLEVLIENRDHLFRGQPFSKASKLAYIRKKHSDFAALPLQLSDILSLDDLLHHMLGNVSGEIQF